MNEAGDAGSDSAASWWRRFDPVILVWGRRFDPLILAWLAVTVVAWGARGFTAGLYRDAAFYVYAGQLVAAGNPPYVEVMNRAGPYANILPGVGVELGRLLGVSDAVGARLLFFLLVALVPTLLYVTARDLFRSRLAGCATATTMLGFVVIARLSTSGPESKLAMVAGLSIALLLLVKRRWLLAGIATGVVTLTWQPVLVAIAPAAAMLILFGKGPLRERITAALWYAAGGLAALAVTVCGFALAGATDAFVEGFWTANAQHTQQAAALERPHRVWEHLRASYGWGVWLLVLGSLAAVALGPAAWWLRRSDRQRAAGQTMLAVSCLGGLVWTGWFAFERAPDSVLLLPAAALGIGGMVGVLAHLVRRSPSPHPRRVLGGAVAVWAAIAVVTTGLHTYDQRSDTLHEQKASSDAVFDNVPEDATVFSFEVPHPLALSHRTSISRFVLFDHGMVDFIDAETPGGMRAYVDGLIEAEPDVVLIPTDTRFKVVKRMLRPYVRVGYGPSWKVFLREDLGPVIHGQVAEALVESRLPFRE